MAKTEGFAAATTAATTAPATTATTDTTEKTVVDTTTKAPTKVIETPVADKPSELPAAPASLFANAAAAEASNPARVAVITALLSDYVAKVGSSQSNLDAAKSATFGLFNAVRQLGTLGAADTTAVTDLFINAIKNDKNGSFGPYLYAHVDEIRNSFERQNYVRLMNLFTIYARLQNKANLKNKCNVEYSVALVADATARKALQAYFTK